MSRNPHLPTNGRACCFCGKPFSISKRSREHVVPQWLLKYSGVLPKDRHFFGTVRDDGNAKIMITPAYSQVYKKVCSSCNSGWLSHLEGEAKRIIDQIVIKDEVILCWADIFLLNAWAYKVFALTHLSEGGDREKYIREEDLNSLCKKLMPEGDSYMAVARSSEARMGKLNIHLFQNRFITSAEEAEENDLSLTQCFVGMLRTSDVMFLFAYVPPGREWALEIDPRLKGITRLWPAGEEAKFAKTSLLDVSRPEDLRFYFFHPEDQVGPTNC
jgi:hypothetical protein